MLDAFQKEAVRTTEPIACVSAGAGSGKTRVIVARIIHLLEESVDPSRVAVITYTNNSALEIRERVTAEFGSVPDLFVGTMNAFALKSLLEHRDKETWPMFNRKGWASNNVSWDVIDDDAVERCIKEIRDSFGKKVTLKALRKGLSTDLSVPPKSAKGSKERQVRVALRSSNSLTQDDLVIMLADGAENLELDHLIIDEAQDLPHSHKRLVSVVSKSTNIYLCFDDAQSIFSFLSARQEKAGIAPHPLLKGKVYQLRKNYRSAVSIVELVNQVRSNLSSLGHCTPLKSIPCRSDQGEVIIKEIEVECSPTYEERISDTVLDEIAFEFLTSDSVALIGRTWKDIALFRPHLERLNLIGSSNMNLSLKLPANRGVLSLARIIKSGTISESDLDHIATLEFMAPEGSILKRTASASELVKMVYRQEMRASLQSVLEDFVGGGFWSSISKVKTMDGLVQSWMEMGAPSSPLLRELGHYDLNEFISESHKMREVDAPKKVCTTVHGAKGLEYDTVIVYGVSDGIFPSSKDKTELQIGEAGRSLYTAITRARDRLILLNPTLLRNKKRSLSPFF